MGRTILADDRIQNQIEVLYTQGDWAIGFIIGQNTPQRDYAVHLIRTPIVEEDRKSEGSSTMKPAYPVTLDVLDDLYVATHAKQAVRMLPGGVDIIGLFAAAPPDMMKKSMMRLKQVVFAVDKVVSKASQLARDKEVVTDRILLQICTLSRKLTCRTFDVTDSKDGAKPAEWKFQSHLDRWLQLNTNISFHLNFPVPAKNMSASLSKQILNGISPLCQNIRGAMATVGGKLLPGESVLDTSSHQTSDKKGKKGKKALRDDTGQQQYEVQLYAKLVNNNNINEAKCEECGADMTIRGTMCARAFVHNRATVSQAVQALKEDVIRSLVSRCELLCEDLLQTEEEQDEHVLYETPVRIFGALSDSPLCLCDYMFQEESPSDSLDRFRELVDLNITEADLDMNQERIPNEKELYEPLRYVRATESEGNKSESSSSVRNIMGMVVGGIVAALAAGISYMYIGDQ